MRQGLGVVVLMMLCGNASASLRLQPGDIQFVSYNAIESSFSFVTWVTIPRWTIIEFLDWGYSEKHGEFKLPSRSGSKSEGVLRWEPRDGDVAPGTVIAFHGRHDRTFSLGRLRSSVGTFHLVVGDQLFVVTGSISRRHRPWSLGFGMSMTGEGWADWNNDSRRSNLPMELDVPKGNLAIRPLTFYAQYIGPRNGHTLEEYQLMITDPRNWARTRSAPYPPNLTPFQFRSSSASVPEPATGTLGTAGAMLLLAHRQCRRRRRAHSRRD